MSYFFSFLSCLSISSILILVSGYISYFFSSCLLISSVSAKSRISLIVTVSNNLFVGSLISGGKTSVMFRIRNNCAAVCFASVMTCSNGVGISGISFSSWMIYFGIF